MKVKNYRDHRIFYTNLLKRSRYFIANYAKIDIFKETLGKQEIGYRFFEGVAAGTVMLGQPPASPIFDRYFDWEDVIIRMPVDVENIELIIEELDRQPERLEQIRRRNVYNALLKHDWLYRWQKVLEVMGLPQTQAMSMREQHLQDLAQSLEKEQFALPSFF